MLKTNSRIFTVTGLMIMSLLLASCSSVSEISANPEPDTQITQTPSASQETAGAYIPYETYKAEAEKYADSEVVLFFNASWCSTCKLARGDFEASLNQIPKDLTIVVVDFDDSLELRKKYGVTLQHTFVQIDNSGEALGKWSGSVTVAEIVEQLS